MAALLDFTTSGVMTISLQGARFGNLLIDPDKNSNVKRFSLTPDSIELEVHNMNNFSGWGRVEIVDEGSSGATMSATIDSNAGLWYGTAQFKLHAGNGQHVVSDNFQSGVGGTDSKRSKRYNIQAL